MTAWTSQDDGHAPLWSHDVFAEGPPLNTFARLRSEAPLHWSDWPQGRGFWSLTRYADIMALNRQPDLLSSAQGIRMEDQSPEEYLARRTFQETDPPEHTRTRMLVNRAFAKPVVARFEQAIRDICIDILDRVLPMGTFDATRLIARELPMRMLGRIVGLPGEDLPWLVEKGDALIANTDPQFTAHVLDRLETDAFRMMPFNSPAGAELYAYARDLMARKEAAGDTTGVLHLIRQPDSQGDVISETEFRNFFCLLVAAGNDTTRYSIAAGIHALANQPGLLEEMREGGTVWETAADEIIRWAAPTMHFRRTTTRDFDIHGQKVRRGDKVLLWFVSGNRDAEAFDAPDRLDLHRKPNRHMSFGQGGPHVCLGMWLAQLEVRVLFQELAARIRAIEPAGTHAYLRSNFIGGIKALPVRVTPV